MRLESLLQRQNTKIVSVGGALQNDGQNPSNPFGYTGGGGGNWFRWETQYRIRCVFNTSPVWSSSGSSNSIKDLAAFNDAVTFLSTWHTIESWDSGTPEFQYSNRYHGSAFQGYHNYSTSLTTPDWQPVCSFTMTAARSNMTANLKAWNARFRCVRFTGNYRININGTDETGSDVYMPDARLDPTPITEHWSSDWYDRIPYWELDDWDSGNQHTFKSVNYSKFDAGGTYSGFYTLSFARKVIDDMTGDPYSPYTFSTGPEAGTTGTYSFPATLIASGPITSEGDVEIEVEWGPP